MNGDVFESRHAGLDIPDPVVVVVELPLVDLAVDLVVRGESFVQVLEPHNVFKDQIGSGSVQVEPIVGGSRGFQVAVDVVGDILYLDNKVPGGNLPSIGIDPR